MVLQYHSKHGYALIGKESTWGTAVSATKDIGLVQDLNHSPTVEWKQHYSISSTQPQQKTSGKFGILGNLEVLFQHGRLLEYITGGTVTHATTSNDTKHTFTISDTLPSMTLEDGYNSTADITQKLKGLKLHNLAINLALDGELRLRTDFFARDIDPSGTSASSAVIDNLPVLVPFHADLKVGTEDSEASLNNVQNLEIVINRVEGEPKLYGFNSRLAQAHEINRCGISFRWGMGFTSITQLQSLLGGSTGILTTANAEIASKGMIFDIKNEVALGSGQRQLYVDLSDIQYIKLSHRHVLGNYIWQEFEGFALTLESLYTVDDIVEASW